MDFYNSYCIVEYQIIKIFNYKSINDFINDAFDKYKNPFQLSNEILGIMINCIWTNVLIGFLL